MALDIDGAILGSGLIAIGATVFAESGLLIGFFLPGDTLLLGAGILASQGSLPIGWLLVVVIVCAILGDNVGYSIGHSTGKKLLKKKDSILFQKEHIERAERFYEKHGGKTIILARFVPMVRTFAPVVAGMGNMSRQRFLAFNIIGGVLWGGGVTLFGYFLGNRMPWIQEYIDIVLIGIIAISLLASMAHLFKKPGTRQLFMLKVKLALNSIKLKKSN